MCSIIKQLFSELIAAQYDQSKSLSRCRRFRTFFPQIILRGEHIQAIEKKKAACKTTRWHWMSINAAQTMRAVRLTNFPRKSNKCYDYYIYIVFFVLESFLLGCAVTNSRNSNIDLPSQKYSCFEKNSCYCQSTSTSGRSRKETRKRS